MRNEKPCVIVYVRPSCVRTIESIFRRPCSIFSRPFFVPFSSRFSRRDSDRRGGVHTNHHGIFPPPPEVTTALTKHPGIMQTARMDVTILLPHHIDNCRLPKELGKHNILIVCVPQRSRIAWRELHPCLFAGPKRASRRLVRCMLDQSSLDWKRMATSSDSSDEEATHSDCLCQRRMRIPVSTRRSTASKAHKLAIWIQPPVHILIEPYWQGLLIHWEHKLIQATSLAAYFATLGGGFFLCRHLTTALQLAKQQQRMAVLLGDTGMYYRCQVNQAYNYIYAGHFETAKRLLAEVQVAAATTYQPDQVLVQMCQSADLFRRRVKKARQTPALEQSGLVKDDLYRIRMVQDQSLATTDVTAPFRRS